MVRVLWLSFVVACWSSTPAPTPARQPSLAPQEEPPPLEVEYVEPCPRFDVRDPSCADRCPREAPEGWNGCLEKVADLVARGWICMTPNPRECRRCPPKNTGCRVVRSRLESFAVRGSLVQVTILHGANVGVTTSWKATLVDDRGAPIPNGRITLTRIEETVSIGTVQLPPDKLGGACTSSRDRRMVVSSAARAIGARCCASVPTHGIDELARLRFV